MMRASGQGHEPVSSARTYLEVPRLGCLCCACRHGRAVYLDGKPYEPRPPCGCGDDHKLGGRLCEAARAEDDRG